jgi:hypothetical protein
MEYRFNHFHARRGVALEQAAVFLQVMVGIVTVYLSKISCGFRV